jgi:hypothetical protein
MRQAGTDGSGGCRTRRCGSMAGRIGRLTTSDEIAEHYNRQGGRV